MANVSAETNVLLKVIQDINVRQFRDWMWLKSRLYNSDTNFTKLQSYLSVLKTLQACNNLLLKEISYGEFIAYKRSEDWYNNSSQDSAASG